MQGVIGGEQLKLIVGSSATVAAVFLGALWYKTYTTSKNRIPTQWVKIGTVAELFLYPVKSLAPISSPSLLCTDQGFRTEEINDRVFIVIREEDGTMVTGREIPGMTQIKTSVSGRKLTLTSPDGSTITVDASKVVGSKQKVKIWRSSAEGVDCGDEVAGWLSRNLLNAEHGLRLLYYVDKVAKKMEHQVKQIMVLDGKTPQISDGGRFSDGTAFHLISEASVRDLASRVEGNKPLKPLNFRPNLVITGEKLLPYEEDTWNWVKVGDVIFQTLGPCTRCLFTTVDPANGIKDDQFEPLKTLRKFRIIRDPAKKKIASSPAMGIYLGARSQGMINVGEDIYIPAIL